MKHQTVFAMAKHCAKRGKVPGLSCNHCLGTELAQMRPRGEATWLATSEILTASNRM